ncbi:hypothetical protein Micbo1qcDRAFT_61178 [Microdochium bolleyi]|uniref:RING-type domain-containing protein n=1 Tax=Microdochium bolleyi TaxID=196109 RepID=A0A136J544_9PEZI|nr:hypothetical protein Micbo1qcDRAFT_61178 [Microdochium bolleyi]
MDPAATEFVMNQNRAPGRPPGPFTGQDNARRTCPAFRNSYENGTSSATSPARTAPSYDPVHHGHRGAWFHPPYHYHPTQADWHHPAAPAIPQVRLPGSRSDPTSMLAGHSSQYPARQHAPHGMSNLLTGPHEYVTSSQSFIDDRYSGAYLPSMGGFESFPNAYASSRSQNISQSGNPPNSLSYLNPLVGPFGGDVIATDPARTGPSAPVFTRSPLDARAPRSAGRSEDGQESVSAASASSEDSSPVSSQTSQAPSASRWAPGTSAHSPPRAHQTPARYVGNDFSDDEAEFDPLEADSSAVLMLDGAVGTQASPEARMRAQQVMRGMLSLRRIASGKALATLETVNIADLPEDGKACVICYNEYGVPAPENITEAPLRLPKCKHIFGDHCIKKWFEENDTCPYCRDKVPSQATYSFGRHNMSQWMRAQHLRTRSSIQDGSSGSLHPAVRYRPG